MTRAWIGQHGVEVLERNFESEEMLVCVAGVLGREAEASP